MKNIEKMIFSVICVAMLFASPVFAQETQTEEAVESFLSLTKPYASDNMIEERSIETYYYTTTITTETIPLEKRYVTILVDGTYQYKGTIYLQSYTIEHNIWPTYVAQYAGTLTLNAVLTR